MEQKQIYQEYECENGVTVSLVYVYEYGDVKQIWVEEKNGSVTESHGYNDDFVEAAKYYNHLVHKNNMGGY